MTNVVTFMRGPVTSIERQEPKTEESKARVGEMVKDCMAKLRVPDFTVVERQLLGSLAKLGPMPETERQAAIKDMQVEQGKAKVTDGLRMIVIGAGAEAAIAHLRSELAAIDPEAGTEF